MKILPVYVAHGDGGERGLGPVLGYFSDKKVAQECAKGKGYWNSDGYIAEKMALDTGEGVYLLADTKPVDLDNAFGKVKEQLKKQALAKLTPDEIKALTT